MMRILGPNDPALQALQESIQENPDLKCELTIIPWEEYRGELDKTLADVNPEYDAVCIPGHIWLPQLANDSLLKPFDDLIGSISDEILSTYEEGDIYPSIRKECQFTGKDGTKQYVLPLFTDGHIVFYRSDLVELPELVEPSEWHKYLEKVTLPKGMMPFAMKAHSSEIFLDFLPYLWDFGAELWEPTLQKPLINTDIGLKALDYYITLRKYCPANVHTFGNGEILNALNSGKVAVVTSWGGQAAGIFDEKNNPQADTIKTAALRNAWNATWGVSIPANCSDEKASDTLSTLLQLMGKDTDAKVTRIAGSPVRISSYSPAEKKKFPWLTSQQALLESCKMLPVDPIFGTYLGKLYGEVFKAFIGEKSSADALADAAN